MPLPNDVTSLRRMAHFMYATVTLTLSRYQP